MNRTTAVIFAFYALLQDFAFCHKSQFGMAAAAGVSPMRPPAVDVAVHEVFDFKNWEQAAGLVLAFVNEGLPSKAHLVAITVVMHPQNFTQGFHIYYRTALAGVRAAFANNDRLRLLVQVGRHPNGPDEKNPWAPGGAVVAQCLAPLSSAGTLVAVCNCLGWHGVDKTRAPTSFVFYWNEAPQMAPVQTALSPPGVGGEFRI